MSYYFLYQQKKIPSFVAYLFIFIISLTLIVGFKSGSRSTIISRASKETTPLEVLLSNRSSESLSVSFVTKEVSHTYIRYHVANDNNFITKFDSRDSKTQTARKLHYFNLSPLTPQTKYELEIYSEGKKYVPNNSAELTFQTLKSEVNRSTYPPIYGKILAKNFQPQGDVLVKVALEKTPGLYYSTLTKSSGEWILTLANVRNERGTQIEIEDQDLLRLSITTGEMDKSTVRSQYQFCRPLRTIVLGQNYDFSDSSSSTTSVMGVRDTKGQNNLISYPRNGAILNSFYPVFRGKITPLTMLQLVLMPQQTVYSLTSDVDGQWRYNASEAFPPGSYQAKVVNVKTRESETITFHIGKSGEQVLGEATKSAEPVITITPSIEEPTPILVEKITPTKNLPSPTITLLSPTITKKQIPITGITNNNILILLSSGISLLGLFLVLY